MVEKRRDAYGPTETRTSLHDNFVYQPHFNNIHQKCAKCIENLYFFENLYYSCLYDYVDCFVANFYIFLSFLLIITYISIDV